MTLLFNPWAWLVAIAMLAGSYGSGRWHQYRSDIKAQAEARFAESENARLRERAAQVNAQRNSDAEKAKYRLVAGERDALLVSVRNRPSRVSEPAGPSCTGATGAQLYRDDAEFLVREAARADELRASLDACQQREAVTP